MKTSNRTSSPAHLRQMEVNQRPGSKLPPPAHSGGGKLSSRPQSADIFQVTHLRKLTSKLGLVPWVENFDWKSLI